MKKKKNKINIKFIIYAILLFLYTISNISLIFNIIRFKNIENLIRGIIYIILSLINLGFIYNYYISYFKKKKNEKKYFYFIKLIIIILLLIVNIFINFNLKKVYNTLDNISTSYEEYTLSLVTLKDNNVDNIEDIDDSIGVIGDTNIENGYNFAKEIIDNNNIKQELIKYETYLEIVGDLYDGKIKYAFLPDNYVMMFNQNDEYKDIETKFKTLHNDSKKIEIEEVNKDINKPFSILLMGVDTLTSSYNADTLLLVTFNPNTLTATMLSIPRDTYTTIACTGGKHKINSSGWYSDKCVVDTVSYLVDIDIDYYAKINFTGIVDLVDNLGGIDVDVVYPFCEQDSKRSFENMIYVEEGFQHLNGEQALALSRNRHFWPGMCPDKYNQKGYYDYNLRNDITRGLNQQLVLKGILGSLTNVKDLNIIYGLLDTIGNNVSTNMDKDTMLSFYNIFKNIITTSNGKSINSMFDIKKLSMEVYGTYVNISGLNLSMIIPHKNSINVISNAMKENLELKEKEVIKTFSFNINNPYEEKTIGKDVYGGTTLNLLDDLVGKSYADALNYCNDIGYECEFNYIDITDGSYSNNQIISQSPNGNYDMSLIRNKKIIFDVAKVINTNMSFDYSLCINSDYKDNNKCMIPDFTNKTIKDFNNWYKNFTYIKVELNEINDDTKNNGLITSQSIINKSIFDIYNDKNAVIKIGYIKNESVNNNEQNKDEDDIQNDNVDNNNNNNENNNTENNVQDNTGNKDEQIPENNDTNNDIDNNTNNDDNSLEN